MAADQHLQRRRLARLAGRLALSPGRIQRRREQRPPASPPSISAAAPLRRTGNPHPGQTSIAIPPALGPITAPTQYTMTNKVLALGRSSTANSSPSSAIPWL